MEMTREEVTAALARDGYQPFLQTMVGSVVNAQAWTGKPGRQAMVIVLYRKDTDEVVDLDNLPDDAEDRPELIAFLDDFGGSVFRRQ